MLKISVPSILRTLARKKVRYDRLNYLRRNFSRDACGKKYHYKNQLLSLQCSVRIMRRRVVSAIDNRQLELLLPDEETSWLDLMDAKYFRDHLSPLLMAICRAAIRGKSYDKLPLFPLISEDSGFADLAHVMRAIGVQDSISTLSDAMSDEGLAELERETMTGQTLVAGNDQIIDEDVVLG